LWVYPKNKYPIYPNKSQLSILSAQTAAALSSKDSAQRIIPGGLRKDWDFSSRKRWGILMGFIIKKVILYGFVGFNQQNMVILYGF